MSILIIFSQVLTKVSAQDFEETLRFADYQFHSGSLREASETYQRALFFSEGRNNFYIFSRIADISYIEKDYETAQRYYGLAYDVADNDSTKSELLFNKASCQILAKNFQLALIDLFSVNDTSEANQRRLYFYLATCYYGLQDYNKAESCFGYCIKKEDKEKLSDLFADKKLYSPSPRKARIMSMILPGLGQTYSGDIKSGINSFLLSSGLIALGVRISIIYSPVDALFAVLPWFQRYYTGGYWKAEEIAGNRLQKHRSELYGEIINLIARDHYGK